MANANVFLQHMQPIRSVNDYMTQMDEADARRAGLAAQQHQNALMSLGLRQKLDADREAGLDRDALRSIAGQHGSDTAKMIEALRASGRPALLQQAGAKEDQALKRTEVQAKAGQENAAALKSHLETMKLFAQGVMANPTPENASLALSSFERLTGRQMPEERQKLAALTTPEQVRLWAAGHSLSADKLLPQFQLVNNGKVQEARDFNPVTNPSGPAPVKMTTTPGEDLSASTQRRGQDISAATTRRGQDMTDARQREGNQIQRDAIGKVDWKQDTDGNWIALPKEIKDGAPVTPVATTAPGKREVQARHAIDIIKEARGLIDKGTSSYAGAAADQAARVVGMSTPGGEAASQLKALEGALMMAQPRMEGPQSDKDVALYRQMAGQIGDPTVPAGNKKAAIDVIERLHGKYTKGKPATGKPSVSNW